MLAGDEQQSRGPAGALGSPPALPHVWEQRELTRGGSGGGSLPWEPPFAGLQQPVPFSFTCFLLPTTPILSESTEQMADVRRLQHLCTKSSPQTLQGGQLDGVEVGVQ